MKTKNVAMTMLSLTAILVMSFMGCSGDNVMNAQYQEPAAAGYETGSPDTQNTTLDESGTGFSRYSIGVDFWGGGDDVYYQTEKDTTSTFGEPGF